MADTDTSKIALSLDGYVHIAEKEGQLYAKKTEIPDVPVKSVKTSDGTTLAPDAGGAVTLPAAPSVPITAIHASDGSNIAPEGGVVTLPAFPEDAVKGAKVGSAAVTNNGGTLEFPAYPDVPVKGVTYDGRAVAPTTDGIVAIPGNPIESIKDSGGTALPITDGTVTLPAPPDVPVKSVKTSGGTTLTPDSSGAVTLPAAPEVPVKGVKSGTDTLTPDASGIVTVPKVTSLDGLDNTSTDYQSAAQVQAAINSALASVHEWKGTKATVAQLPTSGNKTGDTWHVTEDGGEYSWNGSAWEALGIDMSGFMLKSDYVFATNAQIDAALGYTN